MYILPGDTDWLVILRPHWSRVLVRMFYCLSLLYVEQLVHYLNEDEML